MLALITGGARSGKSRFAEAYAARLGRCGTYVATSQIFDEEMRERVAQHRREREAAGFPWRTVEEPYDLPGLLLKLCGGGGLRPDFPEAPGVVLVDCLTLWLSNVLLRGEETPAGGACEAAASAALAEIERLVAALGQLREDARVLLVTNEVGSGVVPEYPLGRLYRDLAGTLNQRVAAACDQLFLVTAGIPVELKSLAFRLPDLPE